ncbi:MAG: hypothetical protein KJO55_03375 [Gammaproteobacteria bacterium]|nr:hypothetical protein [Gammaproteobacteria bacterium]
MSELPPIGVIAALPAEARTFGARLPCNSVASLGGYSLLFVCGVGPDNARRAVDILASAGVAGLVSWGTAGALDPRLTAGDCVLPQRVQANGESYDADAAWSQRIAERLDSHVTLYRGVSCSVDEVVPSAQAKQRLFSQTGALIVDNESAAIAAAARAHGIPWIAVRVVMDDAASTLPDFTWRTLDEQGFTNLGRITWHLVKHPADLVTVPRLLHDYGKARFSLSRVFRDAGPRLMCP